MATIYTDGLYSKTNLGIPSNVNPLQTDFFSLSSLGNEVVLFSAGVLNSQNVVGIGYNETSWAAATPLAVPVQVVVSSFKNGVATGEAPTTLVISVSAASLPFALLYANRQAVNITYVGGTLTYAADLSAATPDVSDPNRRRVWLLGYAG